MSGKSVMISLYKDTYLLLTTHHMASCGKNYETSCDPSTILTFGDKFERET